MLKDIVFAVRVLSKSLRFTLFAAIVLALGIGANTAIFSVVNAVLLRPLPYPDSKKLVCLYERNVVGDGQYNVVSPKNFDDWRSLSKSFEDISAYNYNGANLSSDGESLPDRIILAATTWTLFRALGVKPERGRLFTPDDDRFDAPAALIISDSIWRNRYGSDPNIIGKQVHLDGVSHTIIGVMPPDFSFPSSITQCWAPLYRENSPARMAERDNHFLEVVARLRLGVPLAAAQQELDSIARNIKSANPNVATGKGATVALLQDRIAAPVKTLLLILLAAVGCVLLIACINIANLLSVRAAGRRKEIAIRLALGSSSGRIVRQLLVESVLLSLIGGMAGIGLAAAGMKFLISSIPTVDSPGGVDPGSIKLDWQVMLFALGASLFTGIVVGLIPALSSSRTNLIAAINESGRSNTAGRGHARLRRVLIAGEVALSFVLLFSSALLIGSFQRLRQVRTGINPDRILTMSFALPLHQYKTREQRADFLARLLERTRAVPGVESAALVNWLPFNGHWSDRIFLIPGRPPLPAGQFLDALYRSASPGYFGTIGIPLLKGREFTDADRFENGRKVIISREMAREFFPDEEPIGRHLSFTDNDPHPFEIVGVAGDTLTQLADQPEPTMYFPILGDGSDNDMASLVVKSASPNGSLAAPVEEELHRLDPEVPVSNVRKMEQIVSGNLSDSRFSLVLLGVFAGLALLLATVGLYGVVSYSVAERQAELGVRMALGATARKVMALVLIEGIKPMVAGLVVGAVLARGAYLLIQSLLYGAERSSFMLIAAVIVLLSTVSAMACIFPARRASRIDPIQSLRTE